MRKTAISAVLILPFIASLLAFSTSYAQTQNPSNASGKDTADDVVRVNTTLVTLPVRVMDRHGRFIPDLKQEQFRLYEDGIEQEIAYFESAEKPFTVALLLDTSDSTKFKLKSIQDAATAFISQLRPEDRVILIAFDKRVAVLAEATSNRGLLDQAILRAKTGGGTSLYNAVDLVIRHELSRLGGRKAIVLLTDGVDTASVDATYLGTLYAAQELDALVYAIQYHTYDDVTRVQLDPLSQGQMVTGVVTAKGEALNVAYERANRYLRLLADKTGGRFLYADTLTHLGESFARIAAELRQQYSLGYYPRSKAFAQQRRELKVSVSEPNVVVRARKSYVYRQSAR
jgi:Ca-activated chloride channel family protein